MKPPCNRNCDVLVVGAGPAGLTIANILARTSLKFIIVEKGCSGLRPSRATGLQPRVLNIFEALGIKDQIVKQSIMLLGSRIYLDGNQANTVSFFDPHTRSFALSLDQQIIEAILASTLQISGAHVEWDKRIMNLNNIGGRWSADIVVSDTILENITADIIVACDGGRSTVRTLSKIGFSGQTYTETAFISDCCVSSDLTPGYVYFFFSAEYRLVLVPLSNGKYKVSGGMRIKPAVEGHTLISKMAKSLYPGKLIFEEVSDFRFYRIHARSADVFVKDNIFLCGDAAHLFPPNGGQGLNVAIEDAAFLGQLLKRYNVSKRLEDLEPYASRKIQTDEKLNQVKMTKARYSYENLILNPIKETQETKRVVDEEL